MTSSADRCGRCGVRLTWAKTGRPALYCSTRCRVAAYRARPRQLDVLDLAGAVDPAPEVPAAAVDQVLDVVPTSPPPAARRRPPAVTFRSAGPFGPAGRRAP